VIDDRLKGVINRELGLSGYPLDETTVASQVPGWDSLSHVRILGAVEAEFGIRFRSLEIMRLKDVGELQSLVRRKLASDAAR
jgi:acyl carrier protein